LTIRIKDYKNIIKRNLSDCKYVKIFNHHVGSIGAPSIRAVFVRRTNAKLWEVPNKASTDTKTNIFQEESAGFKATTGLKKKVHQGDVSAYVGNVDLISLRQKYNYREHEKKNDKNRPTQTSVGCVQACWHQWTW
jgi:hypothetical protein